jgi:hypothetical protein
VFWLNQFAPQNHRLPGLASSYVNWDDQDGRDRILKGPAEVAQAVGLQKVQATAPVLVFDEANGSAKSISWLPGIGSLGFWSK